MIQLNREELRDKIYACWIGKNIGGTLGTPFEGGRQVNDCKGFTSKPGRPLPNDDLDLQLIWLKAMKENGPERLNARVLGEYWNEYITPFWNEYGICKCNMRFGLSAPISGQYENEWKHSNGAWIRTEIWATLFPADVERAIQYAYEDACVDHGAGEGSYAAIFVAALEAAAFVIKDSMRLIQIGLSKIPQTCKVYQYISAAVDCYEKGLTWLETRNLLTDMTTKDPELGWFQAPANVAYAIVGLLYGAGDFKQTLLIACNCGDDTDCTCATVGSLLGIMYGTSVIPEDWQAYIGDDIVTISLNMGADLRGSDSENYKVPDTCTELTDEVCALHPVTTRRSGLIITEGAASASAEDLKAFEGNAFSLSLNARREYSASYESILFKAVLEYETAPEIHPGGKFGIRISLKNKFPSQKLAEFRWLMPEGFTAAGKRSLPVKHRNSGYSSAEFVITAGETVERKNILVLEISCGGHPDLLYIPVTLLS